MQLLVIRLLGWLTARTPEWILEPTATVLGDLMYVALPSRRRVALSNLHHAFPEKARRWHAAMARNSFRRMVETGLLSLATPYLPEARIRRMARLAPSVEGFARALAERPHPVVLATVHFALWESQTWLKLLSPVPLPEFGIIFRPLDNPAADRFVKSTRERFGMRLLSRKEGFADALKILRGNGVIGILFDQNAGMQGALTLYFDRVCSSTELPGLLAAKFDAEVRTFYPRRTGFWRVAFESDPITSDGSTEGITIALNRWLESTLRADENLCAAWLWSHARWRNQDVPERRLRLEAKRNLLERERADRGLPALPKRTRIWVRLPNWLGDVVMAAPLLRALRTSRPDAEITLVARRHFLPLLESWSIADRLHPLPARGAGYWRHFWAIRREHVDVWLLFTNSFRGDLEARLAGARQRFGIARPEKGRPLLSHRYHRPPDFDESRHHQLELWRAFLARFGLANDPDLTPLPVARKVDAASAPRSRPIGLIPGSENTPSKRWPVEHWRALIEALPEETFVVFGTANDQPIAEAVALGFTPERVANRCGRTDLPSFAAELAGCSVLVCNDTGGMHLANALGVPIVGLFGPTNPVRTGPIYSAPTRLLQPPHCPPTGGGDLALLSPGVVAEAVHALRSTAGAEPSPSSPVVR